MSKIREIFQNIRPLAWWRRRRGELPEAKAPALSLESSLKELRERSLVLPRTGGPRGQVSWQLVEHSAGLHEAFQHVREALFQFNQKAKPAPASPPPYYWESGKLAENRSYFYMKRWEDMGLLFEETGRGWMISRADKIASQSQFMRERSPWDQALLYTSGDAPGIFRVESELMGEGRVSLTLYEDFLIQTLSKGL